MHKTKISVISEKWQTYAVVFQGSGSGGAPLTMREVEELEKMTKDFIKDMDKHPPVITSPATGTPHLVYTPTPLRFD